MWPFGFLEFSSNFLKIPALDLIAMLLNDVQDEAKVWSIISVINNSRARNIGCHTAVRGGGMAATMHAAFTKCPTQR